MEKRTHVDKYINISSFSKNNRMKEIIFSTLLVIGLCVYQCKGNNSRLYLNKYGEDPLLYLKSYKDVYQNVTKEWHKYIRGILYHIGHKCNSDVQIVSKQPLHWSLKCMKYLSASFCIYSRKDFDEKNMSKRMGNLTYHSMLAGYFPEIFHARVTKLSGEFKITRNFKAGNTNINPQFHWTFRAVPTLAINVTFYQLTFYPSGLPCNLGSVKFQNFASDFLLLCGTYSNVLILSQSHNVDITAEKSAYVQLKAYFGFAVTTAYVAYSFMNANEIQVHFIPSLFIPKYRIALLFYKLQVKKYQVIVLKASEKIFETIFVFDGPGLKSLQLKPNKYNVNTSTFQCVLLTYRSVNEILNKSDEFSFSHTKSMYAEQLMLKSDENVSLDYITKKSNTNYPKVFHIKSDSEIYLNISHFVYLGVQSATCSYGGLSVEDIAGNKAFHASVLCHQNVTSVYQHRSIYSSDKYFIVVAYSYKSYSEINVNIEVCTTSCQAVTVDACTLDLLAERRWQSAAYLNEVSHFSNLTLKLSRDYASGLELLFSVNQSDCAIIKITQVENMPNTVCLSKLSVKSLLDVKLNELTYTIRGSLTAEGDLLLVGGEADVVCFDVKYKGHTKKGCANSISDPSVGEGTISPLFALYKLRKFLGIDIEWNDKVQKQIIYRVNETIDFYFHSKSSIPLQLTQLYPLMKLVPWSNTWIDIKIEWEVMKETKDPYAAPGKIPMSVQSNNQTHYIKLLPKDLALTLEFYEKSCAVENSNTLFESHLQASIRAEQGYYFQYVKLIFKSNFSGLDMKKKHIISVPGELRKLSLIKRGRCKLEYVNVRWVDLYSNYKHKFERESSSPCESYQSFYKECLQFLPHKTFDLRAANFKFHARTYFIWEKEHFTNKKVSWKKANQHCNLTSTGNNSNTLPNFRDRNELEELLAILNIFPDTIPLQGIYIGLIHEPQTKQKLKWSQGDPLTFQLWTNKHYGKNTRPMYEIFYRGRLTNFTLPSVTQNISTDIIYPLLSQNVACTMMLLSNLAEPEWISIGCDEPLLKDVVCVRDNNRDVSYLNYINLDFINETEWCTANQIKRKEMCIEFIWEERITNIEKNILHLTSISFLDFLFESISVYIQPLILRNTSHNNKVQLISYCKVFDQIRYSFSSFKEYNSGYVGYMSTLNETFTLYNLFQCSQGSFISQQYVCDGEINCPGEEATDEMNCNCSIQNASDSKCSIICIGDNRAVCSLLYNRTENGNCVPFSLDRAEKVMVTKRPLCNNISDKLVNDLVVDCPNLPDEELDLKLLITKGTTKHCKGNKLPCKEGHSSCFDISDICKYRLNIYGYLVPCRTGGHIESCSDFECNMMFKCPEFYCIPWAYVCDGKWDCPCGSDEKSMYGCGQERQCHNMYKCQNREICILLGNVCDGYIDCFFEDDESLCDIETQCPSECSCLSLAIHCINSSFSESNFLGTFPYISVSILFFKDFNIFALTSKLSFVNVHHLYLIGDNISHVCRMAWEWKALVVMHLSHNLITVLTENCFYNLNNLAVIKLKSNRIRKVEAHSFNRLPQLKIVDLSFNLITIFMSETFYEITTINKFNVRENYIKQIHKNAFTNIVVKNIFTSQYHLCCMVPSHANCHYIEKAWYISCSNLLPKLSMRYVLAAILSMLILINTLSFLLHLFHLENIKFISVLIIAVNLNDIVCTSYNTFLLTVDIHYDGHYIGSEYYWRTSAFCFALFSFALLFSLTSPLLLTILSLARLMVVLYPFDTRFKKSAFTIKCIVLSWTPVLLLTIGIACFSKFMLKELPTGLCLPFIDPNNSQPLYTIITWLLVLLQLTSSASIIVMYILLVKSLQKSQANLNMSRKTSNKSMIMQLVIISLSNILCWLPTSSIYAASLLMSTYPIGMVVWTTIAVMPVNSIINPLIFIITTGRKLYQDCC